MLKGVIRINMDNGSVRVQIFLGIFFDFFSILAFVVVAMVWSCFGAGVMVVVVVVVVVVFWWVVWWWWW